MSLEESMRCGCLVLLLVGCPVGGSSDLRDDDGDGFLGDVDCDDGSAAVHPNATEVCGNNIDDNCDGVIDDDGLGATVFHPDSDGDGFGSVDVAVTACSAPTRHVADGTDCDDASSAIHPDAADDQCDGVDDNCDGEPDDEAERYTYYRDDDGDGFGVVDETSRQCRATDGWAADSGDCDDKAAKTHPGASEVCDDEDNDCDEVTDEGVLGTGFECPAETCLDLHAREPVAKDGFYWLSPEPGSPFNTRCSMDDAARGPGWTEITTEILESQEWVTWSIKGGQALEWIGEWRDGEMLFVPHRHNGAVPLSSCETVALRATATLPFEFDGWYGSWQADFFGNDNQNPGWGESIDAKATPGCSGAVKFGVPDRTSKPGRTWGTSVNDERSVTWPRDSEPYDAVFPTDKIQWELNGVHRGVDSRPAGMGTEAELSVYDISIWVR